MFGTCDTIRIMSFSDLEVDFSKREVRCGERRAVVKSTSFRLLTLLLENAENVVSREFIFRGVWGVEFDPGTKRLEVQLNYLRSVLRAVETSIQIKTHWGRGLELCEVERSEA